MHEREREMIKVYEREGEEERRKVCILLFVYIHIAILFEVNSRYRVSTTNMEEQYNNFDRVDAFDEVNAAEGLGSGNKVHIRVQQRNRRKCILTVQGLDDDLDLKKICKALRKNLQCNGNVTKDKEYGDILQLQGDHREAVKQFLIGQEIVMPNQLMVHGD